jgi:hypothetical protein
MHMAICQAIMSEDQMTRQRYIVVTIGEITKYSGIIRLTLKRSPEIRLLRRLARFVKPI